MKKYQSQAHGFVAIGTLLVVFTAACAASTSQDDSSREKSVPHLAQSQISKVEKEKAGAHRDSLQFVKGETFLKMTEEDCLIRGGEYMPGSRNILPQDMVDCALPAGIKVRGPGGGSLRAPKEILGSVYDYLYKVAGEKPDYGLYSYVLLPMYSLRAEHFLKDFFNTTSFVEIEKITTKHLNITYLPTKRGDLARLIPEISDGSPPPAHEFAKQFYDYSLARKLFVQACIRPLPKIQDACNTALSRGPYLFTFPNPASSLSPVPPPYLFVDLSDVHERAFGEFIDVYKEQIKRSDYSDRKRIDNLRLEVLSIILTAADWINPISGALADTVYVVGGQKD